MLYLNDKKDLIVLLKSNLTLTSVVFEFYNSFRYSITIYYLTLTSVVFEFAIIQVLTPLLMYLTLTSVVFECVNFDAVNLF